MQGLASWKPSCRGVQCVARSSLRLNIDINTVELRAHMRLQLGRKTVARHVRIQSFVGATDEQDVAASINSAELRMSRETLQHPDLPNLGCDGAQLHWDSCRNYSGNRSVLEHNRIGIPVETIPEIA